MQKPTMYARQPDDKMFVALIHLRKEGGINVDRGGECLWFRCAVETEAKEVA